MGLPSGVPSLVVGLLCELKYNHKFSSSSVTDTRWFVGVVDFFCYLFDFCAVVSVVVCCLFVGHTMSQSTRRGSTQRTKPSFGSDNKGWYITVACGSLTGQLYVNKLDWSKKILDKYILAKGTWYSPPEFEVFGGRKSKKWRYSLLHKGRPLTIAVRWLQILKILFVHLMHLMPLTLALPSTVRPMTSYSFLP